MTNSNNALFAQVPGQQVWLTNVKPTGKHLGSYARKRVWAVDSKPKGQEVDLAEVAQTLTDITNQVNGQYVDRQRLAQAIMIALASGQHVFVKSPPGAAKTAVANSFATALNGTVSEVQFGIDTNKDELIGGYDPTMAAQGKWVRNFDRFATADIAIADEIWESPSEITNLLKGLLNEAVVEGEQAPLKTCMAMSNVLPADYRTSADYDRFLIRLTLDYIQDVDDFGSMLTSVAGDVDIDTNVCMSQVMILAAVSQYQAKHDPNQEIIDGMKDIWTRFKDEGIVIGDRRWGEAYKLAYANALAQGEAPSKHHLMIAEFCLWVDPADEQRARRIIFEIADKFAAAKLAFDAKIEEQGKLYDEALSSYQQFDPANQDARVEATTLVMQLETDLEGLLNGVKAHSDETEWTRNSQPLIDTLNNMLDNTETLMLACRKKTVDRPDPLNDGQGLSRRSR